MSPESSLLTSGFFLGESSARVLERCDILATISERPDQLLRTFASDALRTAHKTLLPWMEDAGLDCQVDAACNLMGRYSSESEPARTLLIGSHIDTVPNAGRYDGVLGVLLGLAAIEALHRADIRLPFHIDLIAFSDEEGVRFGVPFLGSRAFAGTFDAGLLERIDATGISLRDAVARFGQVPEQILSVTRSRDQFIGYLEPHIEQGPVLERLGLPVGVVTAIAGQTRASLRFVGAAGHAGTVPMNQRRDALTAAARWIAEVETHARRGDGLVATVGQIEAQPNAINVIPGEVRVGLDVRHARDAIRESAVMHLLGFARQTAADRGVECLVDWSDSETAVATDANLTGLLDQSVVAAGHPETHLVSGAGHDAVHIARLAPVSMLFLRCGGGISHHPDESVLAADVGVALEVIVRFLLNLRTELALLRS